MVYWGKHKAASKRATATASLLKVLDTGNRISVWNKVVKCYIQKKDVTYVYNLCSLESAIVVQLKDVMVPA